MDFRRRLEMSKTAPVNRDEAITLDELFKSGFFAVSNLRDLPMCLDLRLPTGQRMAFPYSYISQMTFDRATGITILAGDHKITITGRNLDRLFDHLLAYRVRYVQTTADTDENDDGLVVEGIEVGEGD